MVAVTAPGAAGALSRRLAGARARVGRGVAAVASRAAAAATAAWRGLLACQALAGLLLVAYGAWSAWPPAGFIVGGLGLLADRAAEEIRARGDR